MQSEATLLPCPFCEDTARLMQTLDDDWIVSCVNEECKGHVGYFEAADEAIAAWNTRLASASAPGGWRMVPVEPTEGMLVAGAEDVHHAIVLDVWSAMLTAAPQPPAVGETTCKPSLQVAAIVGEAIETAWNGSGSNGLPNHLPPIDLSEHERGHLGAAAIRAFAAITQPAEERMREAAKEVLSHRVGEQPTRGWLRDNDASRTALTHLAAALKEPRDDR